MGEYTRRKPVFGGFDELGGKAARIANRRALVLLGQHDSLPSSCRACALPTACLPVFAAASSRPGPIASRHPRCRLLQGEILSEMADAQLSRQVSGRLDVVHPCRRATLAGETFISRQAAGVLAQQIRIDLHSEQAAVAKTFMYRQTLP